MCARDIDDQLNEIRDRLLELFVEQDEANAANDQGRLDRLKIEIQEQRESMERLRG